MNNFNQGYELAINNTGLIRFDYEETVYDFKITVQVNKKLFVLQYTSGKHCGKYYLINIVLDAKLNVGSFISCFLYINCLRIYFV